MAFAPFSVNGRIALMNPVQLPYTPTALIQNLLL